MSRHHEPREEIWIILRADLFQRPELFHGPEAEPETAIIAEAVFRSRERAEQEVDRLNSLHPDRQVRYWCAFSRLSGDGEAPAVGVDPD